jgi:predicted outer membrane repeat protein
MLIIKGQRNKLAMNNYISRLKAISLVCLLTLAFGYTLAAGLGGLRAAQASSGSAVYVVTTTDNAGPGSLRQAILDANANAGVDEIVFDLPGCTPANPCVITLLSLLPAISDPVTITGPGMASLAIDSNHAFRVFNVDGVPAVISDLTIQNGATTGRGAGIRAFGHLMLTRVWLRHNQAEEEGGGVYAAGNLAVEESYFAHNASSHGGGLYGESGLTIRDSQFISNTAVYSGGGAVGKGTALVTETQFEGNVSFAGGGLYVPGEITLEDTMFLRNTATFGGGLSVSGMAQVTEGWFENNHSIMWAAASTALEKCRSRADYLRTIQVPMVGDSMFTGRQGRFC